MIHVNLFDATRIPAATASRAGFAKPHLRIAENAPVLLLAGGLALAAGVVGVWGMLLLDARADLDARIETAKAEQARLAPVLERDADLHRKRDEIARQIGVILHLKSLASLPVHLMELLSESLADHVWLEEMTSDGELVTLHARAQTPLAAADFLRNLEDSEHFADVAMGQLQNDEASGLTRFEVTMRYEPGRERDVVQPPPSRPRPVS